MKILAIDYGRSKIGLAVGDTETGMVEPLTVWPSSKFKFAYQQGVQSLKSIAKEDIEKILIGIPGGKIEKEIREFGKEIQETTGLPVDFFDETLTTQDARKMLLQSGRKRKIRRGMEDAFAAAIMLESYLESRLR